MRRLSYGKEVCLAAALFLAGTAAFGAEAGFVSLFDGKTLDGWTLVDGKGLGYVVEDGRLVCPANGGGNLFSKREYANFALRLEFRLSSGANNGVGRAPLEGRTSAAGMEIQIRDDPSPVYAKAQLPVKNTGSLYDVLPARTGFAKPSGEWNAMEIVASGRRVEVRLNGQQILDCRSRQREGSGGLETAHRPQADQGTCRVPRARHAGRFQ